MKELKYKELKRGDMFFFKDVFKGDSEWGIRPHDVEPRVKCMTIYDTVGESQRYFVVLTGERIGYTGVSFPDRIVLKIPKGTLPIGKSYV